MLVMAAVGILAVTSEYASGTIQASAVAVPVRGRLAGAKAVVVGAAGVVVGQVTAFPAFFASQAVLSAQGAPHLALGQPHVLRAVIGGGLCLALAALFGMAVGLLVRATAGAITITSFVILLPAMASLFPDWLAAWIVKYWPSSAGGRVAALRPDPALLGPWAGLAVLCGFCAAMLAASFLVFRSRDV
jgi:hypothetical protein